MKCLYIALALIPYCGAQKLPSKADCSRQFTCFNYPDNCLNNNECVFSIQYANKKNGQVELILTSQRNGAGYIAFGLSKTFSMGDSYILSCETDGTTVTHREAYAESYTEPISTAKSTSVRLVNGSISSTILQCIFDVDPFWEHERGLVDLTKRTWYLLGAKGDLNG